jgi:hypothetical protein
MLVFRSTSEEDTVVKLQRGETSYRLKRVPLESGESRHSFARGEQLLGQMARK